MKVICLRDKSKFYVDDDVADKIMDNISQLKFIKLPSGDFINSTEIVKIVSPEKKPYFRGLEITPDLNFVIRSGEKVKFDKTYINEVEWIEDTAKELQTIRLN
jgi:hypothetical protein